MRAQRIGRPPARRRPLELPGLAMWAAGIYYVLLLVDNVLIRTAEKLSGYLDEITVLFAAPFAAAALFRMPHGLWPVPLCFGIYIAMGTISGLFSPIGGYPFATVTGLTIALDSKPIILALAFAYCLSQARDSDVMTPFLYALIGVALVNLPFLLRDLALNSGINIYGEPMDRRAGMYRPQGLYHHATASVDIHLMATMAAAALWGIRKNAVWAGLTALLALLTMLHIVAKEIVAVVLVLGIAVMAMRFRSKDTQFLIRAAAVTLGLLLAVPFADLALPVIQGQVTDYVQDGESAVRTLMYLISFDLAVDNFPLGAGIGTFGSLASFTTFFSPIYDQTGLSLIYGASRLHPYYLQDVFWPKVLGESGWIGLAAYLGLLLYLAVRVTRAALKFPAVENLFASFVLVTALVKTIAAPTLTSDLYVPLIGLAVAIAACYPRGFAQAAADRQARAARQTTQRHRPALRGRPGTIGPRGW
ncbi:hypothetical protein ACFOGJ_26940 [Marinibaculum pumilum]|uniref:O-antigen ligase domain-containing protein n=2 Tax=Marinibaculum pumilum TaxID=1766165 RepID=A0ABV7L8A7_9PROT